MSTYTPDKWAIIKIIHPDNDGKPLYKVLGSWYGGFAQGDSWKMNSGITRIEKTERGFNFHGYSGSVYQCNEMNYGTSSFAYSVFLSYKKHLEKSMPTAVFELLSEEEAFKLEV